MWPIHGAYECRTCGRRYAVPWTGPAPAPSPASSRGAHGSWRGLAWLLVAAAVAVLSPWPAKAAEANNSEAAAHAALERYLARGSDGAQQWTSETIAVEAWLPKLAEHGMLRAIRTLETTGQPQYKDVEITGDRTVRQQVLLRYLRTETDASRNPDAGAAIAPANYKFAYRGPVGQGALAAYAFKITPRAKRDGLIKGEIWLDAETAMPIHQAGYLVKRPSFFIKRVTISREYWTSGGVIEARTTRVHIDTRIAGPAELVIEERPLAAGDGSF